MLEGQLPKSRYREPGVRVVQGQRLMQAASDIFLGWCPGVQENRPVYWRQLRDMKASALIEMMIPEAMSSAEHEFGLLLAAPVSLPRRRDATRRTPRSISGALVPEGWIAGGQKDDRRGTPPVPLVTFRAPFTRIRAKEALRVALWPA